MNNKICINCQRLKPFTSFHKNSFAIDRHSDYCITCKTENYEKKKDSDLREENRLPYDNKWCITCNQIKPYKEFGLASRLVKGLSSCCKDCAHVKLEAIKAKRRINKRA